MFQVFHLSSDVCVLAVASGCFKSRSGVAHGMSVGSGRGCVQPTPVVWWRGQRPDGVGNVRSAWAPRGLAKHRRASVSTGAWSVGARETECHAGVLRTSGR
jgi:hypothetical protein